MLLIQQLSPHSARLFLGLIAHYSGKVDLMSGTSYLVDLVDLPCGGGAVY